MKVSGRKLPINSMLLFIGGETYVLENRQENRQVVK